MKLDAIYYDGVHPVGRDVTLLVDSKGRLKIIGADIVYQCQWQEVKVSNQLGETVRSLQLPNGAKCESHDHESINHLENKYNASLFGRGLYYLESHWHSVLVAALVVVTFTWGMVVYGIPELAKSVAQALPVSVDEKLTQGTLTLLDERILSESELALETQKRIEDKFFNMVEHAQDEHKYQLMFRKGLGANAFALPSGHIVITDELIDMADSDEEVLAVLAHEIGHVVHDHGLRSVLQSSAVALLLTAVTGDVGAASGFAAAMPIILLETNYSRKFELEADTYALDYMKANNIDTIHFATILQKISGDVGDEESSPFSYISTHPATFERIKPFKDNSLTK